MMRVLASVPFWQVSACLAGIVACAVPCSVMHRGFWSYGLAVSWSDIKGVRIEQIKPDTPAAALQEKDRILAVNGQALSHSQGWKYIHEIWRQAPVGSEVEFRVLRASRPEGEPGPAPAAEADEVVVRIPRVPDPVAAWVYWEWQIAAGVTFLALGVAILGTCWLRRVAPWRGLLLVAAGTTLIATLLTLNWGMRLPPVWQQIAWSQWSDLPPFPWQKVVIITVAAALVFLGAVDLRGQFWGHGGRRAPSESLGN